MNLRVSVYSVWWDFSGTHCCNSLLNAPKEMLWKSVNIWWNWGTTQLGGLIFDW